MSGVSPVLLSAIFLAAAAAIWAAGVHLSNHTDVLSVRLHLGSTLGGLILLALATNLPEMAIVTSAAVSGNVEVAVGDILGGIAIHVVLVVAGAVLPRAQGVDIYLTALGMLLTVVYVTGLLFRPRRRIVRTGLDSVVVLVLYVLGVAGLFAIANAGRPDRDDTGSLGSTTRSWSPTLSATHLGLLRRRSPSMVTAARRRGRRRTPGCRPCVTRTTTGPR